MAQVESSRQMYHAVMEEVARFLERCHHSLDAFQQRNRMARSRSVNHVYMHEHNGGGNDTLSDVRMRTSTNSMEKPTNLDCNGKLLNDTISSTMTTDSYKNFSDFTWWVLQHDIDVLDVFFIFVVAPSNGTLSAHVNHFSWHNQRASV